MLLSLGVITSINEFLITPYPSFLGSILQDILLILMAGKDLHHVIIEFWENKRFFFGPENNPESCFLATIKNLDFSILVIGADYQDEWGCGVWRMYCTSPVSIYILCIPPACRREGALEILPSCILASSRWEEEEDPSEDISSLKFSRLFIMLPR